jgi:hypothetical protein
MLAALRFTDAAPHPLLGAEKPQDAAGFRPGRDETTFKRFIRAQML